MKKLCIFACIIASLFLFIGASVWEGTAAVSEDLPETGLYIATNSFPINTVVDVINLENGKTSSLIVSSKLEICGFLALLSKDAGDAIDLPGRAVSRIRMIQSGDPLAFSHYTGVRMPHVHDVPLPESQESIEEIYENLRMEGRELIVDLPEGLDVQAAPAQISHVIPDYESLRLVPSEARPPTDTGPVPDPNYFIPQIVSPAPAPAQPPAQVTVPAPTPPPASPPAVFSVPVVTQLDSGMYYLQVAAYRSVEAVQQEISGLDSNMPVIVMRAGTTEEPVYRVLIGPLNLGESGAMLERFRHTNRDVFLRYGG